MLGFLILAFIVLAVFAGIGYAECRYIPDEKLYVIKIRKFLISAGVCMLLTLPLPSASQLKLITSSYFVTNIDGIDKVPANVVKYVNNFLEEEVEERVVIGDKK